MTIPNDLAFIDCLAADFIRTLPPSVQQTIADRAAACVVRLREALTQADPKPQAIAFADDRCA